MGSHRYAAQVPFKINVWNGTDHEKTGSPLLDAILHYLEHTTYEYECGKKRGEDMPAFTGKGWCLTPKKDGRYWITTGWYKQLVVEVLKKEDHTVYRVNEAEYAAGGDVNTCFFADDKASLEQLCDDWNFDKSKIEHDVIIMQTL